jgi:hypothetical protein
MLGRKPWGRKAAGLVPVALVAVALAGCGSTKSVAAPKHFRLVYLRGSGEVMVADLHGTDAHPLGPGAQALLAPSGTLAGVLVAGSGGSVSLSTYQTIRRPRPRVVAQFSASQWLGGGFRLLGWSPDSRFIVLTATALSGGGEQPELLVVNVASGKLARIAAGNFFGASFAPSLPDRLVYSRATVAQLDTDQAVLFTAQPDGHDTRAITTSGLDADPVWGAKGIVFARLRRLGSATRTPRYALWMVAPSGGRPVQLTHFAAGPPAPDSAGGAISVSANGTHIVANVVSPYTTVAVVDIWTVDLERRRIVARRISFGGSQFIAQAIASNGTSILLSPVVNDEPTTPVDLIPWQGSTSPRLVANGGDPSWNH